MTDETPGRLVVDAGPLIGLFFVPDEYHEAAIRGFQQLSQRRATILSPLPIVFEVYKWLAYETDPTVARDGLARMQRTLEIVYPTPEELPEVISVLDGMPTWGGSLEDALVAVTGLRLDLPVWTLNYRDFGAFRNLHFWTPTAS